MSVEKKRICMWKQKRSAGRTLIYFAVQISRAGRTQRGPLRATSATNCFLSSCSSGSKLSFVQRHSFVAEGAAQTQRSGCKDTQSAAERPAERPACLDLDNQASLTDPGFRKTVHDHDVLPAYGLVFIGIPLCLILTESLGQTRPAHGQPLLYSSLL